MQGPIPQPPTVFAVPAAGALVTLGAFASSLGDRLRALGARQADTGDAVPGRARAHDVYVFDAHDAAAARQMFAAAPPRLVVAMDATNAADALDALDAGAHEVIGDDLGAADLEEALFPRPAVRETSAFHTPRLADLGLKMATIAHEIEALLQPNELRHIERGAPSLPKTAPTPVPGPSAPTAAQVRALIRSRRARASFFPVDLFADPAWDILLDLVAARLEGKLVSVSSLCIAAAVPPTTALRWIKTMTDEGLLERKADPADGRRIFIDLSERAAGAMEAYLARAAAVPGGLIAA